MSPLALALIFAILAILFPFLSFVFLIIITRRGAGVGTPALEANVHFLNIALPTLLFILGALGFTSYEVVVNKVTETVTGEVSKKFETKYIDSLKTAIKNYHEQARRDAASIDSMRITAKDTISSIAIDTLLHYLPRGIIIPYSGRISDIDTLHWAICDSKKGTPDLRDRFVLGAATIQEIGRPGGSNEHSHNVTTLTIAGRIIESVGPKAGHRDGKDTPFDIIKYGYTWQFDKGNSEIELTKKSNLPPFIKLVYIMKIR